MLVDRDIERQELRALQRRPGLHLALLYGRRRVGKTSLLRHAWTDASTFYFLASNTTAEINRVDLLRELGTFLGEELEVADFPTWRTVLRRLLDVRPGEPVTVVLDEFQYLLGGDDDITSQLVAVWDVAASDRPFVLALSGSAVTTMAELDDARSPLYGRVEWKTCLRPLDYFHAAELTRLEALRERVRAYAIFGGSPSHLELVPAAASLDEAIVQEALSPRGRVRYLVETAIEQESGLRKTGHYAAVLSAIARGRTELSEIANATGLPHDTGLRQIVATLEALGFIASHRNLGARPNAPYRYRLADPALRFHYAIVARHRGALETTEPEIVWSRIAQDLDSYIGHIFERIVEQAYYRLRDARGLPIVEEWGRWEGLDRNRLPLEMDICARLDGPKILTGAIKWSAKPISAAVHLAHMRDLQRLADSGVAWAHGAVSDDAVLLYVSAAGFEANFADVATAGPQRVELWTLEDLFGDDAAGPRNFG